MLPFAPGSRVVIRDEEWLVRRIDPATDGGWLLTCDGISELVRSQSALFLTALEDEIAVLDPEKTELVPDDTLMLLSATPHDGSARSFASLMSLLDPTATLPGGPRTVERTYTAPFARASREEDYRIAWAFFAEGG